MDLTGVPAARLDAAVATALAHGRAAVEVAGGMLALAVVGDVVLVGPLAAPDPDEHEPGWDRDPSRERGCPACALAWWHDVSPGSTGAEVGPQAAPVVRDLVLRVLADPPARWRRAVLVLDRAAGTVAVHRFLPHPDCPRCAARWRPTRPVDLRAPQPAEQGLRARLPDRSAVLEHLVDARFGPVLRLRRDEDQPLAPTTADLVVPGRARVEHGSGWSASPARADVLAVLDGLARVLGGYRRPVVPVTVARWDEVADRALDPHTLVPPGTALPEAGTATSWVWGRSTRDDRPLLVPEHVAYAHEHGIGARFVAGSTTGTGIGSTHEEAVLHGLLEAVEHDAALRAWAARAPLTEVLLDEDGEHAAVRALLAARGLHLRVLDVTGDAAVPVVLAVASADDTGLPAVTVASGAGATAGDAIRAAVARCAGRALGWAARGREEDGGRHVVGAAHRDGAGVVAAGGAGVVVRGDGAASERGVGEATEVHLAALLADHRLVRSAADHVGLHALPGARHLSTFLQQPAGAVGEAALDARAGLPTGDVVAALRVLLRRLHGRGTDVVVVDQSAPEVVAAVGLRAAKVVVPGALRLTTGPAAGQAAPHPFG
ncbi:hypothetical protein EBM89_15645 [Cellulomonas triticagri]|uniref:YcaO domain-containing protein n=1 Tax=Cellulomonas triticagri TaxID=2483352 RepID=A0A3M2IXV9_9CELL|nr:hypothetical protein EBM89_15645 [Cellulomonas triticagri]